MYMCSILIFFMHIFAGIEGKNRQSSPINDTKDQAKASSTPVCTGPSMLDKEDVKSDNLKNVPNITDCASGTNKGANNNAIQHEVVEEHPPKQSVNQIKINFEKTPPAGEPCKQEASPKSEGSPEPTVLNIESPDQTLCSFAERKMTFEKISSTSGPVTSPETTKRPKRKSQSEARFDPETLELIREIGSALMNSPAKCDIEPDADLDSSGNFSLVRHFVKDIENRTTKERKPSRRIIIIDKETQAKKKRNWRFSAPTPGCEISQQENTNEKRPLAKSISQPVSLLEEGGECSRRGSDKPCDPKRATENASTSSAGSSGVALSDSPVEGEGIGVDKVSSLVGKFHLIETKGKSPPNVKCNSPVKGDSSLESEVVERRKRDTALGNETDSSAQPDESEKSDLESTSPDNIQLRLLKENLRKTNLLPRNRPPSVELRRSNTSPGCAVETVREKLTTRLQQRKSTNDTDPGMVEEKRKVRKLQGRSHPLTKLECRRNNPFYSTM